VLSEQQEQFIALVRTGRRDGLACALCSASAPTLKRWRSDAEFEQAYVLARAEYENELLDRLAAESRGHARAPEILLRELRRWCPGEYEDKADVPTVRLEALIDVEGVRARLAKKLGLGGPG
jgi:flavin-dependent dehydrogenase